MIVAKVINNNLIKTYDLDHVEYLVMGCGLGYKKQPGDEVDESLIEKVYKIQNQEITSKLQNLLDQIPLKHIQAANIVIDFAKKSLSVNLNDNIYITLTDHISYALERASKGIYLKNALLWEIKKYYHTEYQVAVEALKVLEENVGVQLPEDEAGYIAIHLVEASTQFSTMDSISESLEIIQQIISIIKYYFQVELDETSLAYDRFLVHLKFFIERIMKNQSYSHEDDKFFELLKLHYGEEFKCCFKVKEYLLNRGFTGVTDEELAYLAIHIRRII